MPSCLNTQTLIVAALPGVGSARSATELCGLLTTAFANEAAPQLSLVERSMRAAVTESLLEILSRLAEPLRRRESFEELLALTAAGWTPALFEGLGLERDGLRPQGGVLDSQRLPLVLQFGDQLGVVQLGPGELAERLCNSWATPACKSLSRATGAWLAHASGCFDLAGPVSDRAAAHNERGCRLWQNSKAGAQSHEAIADFDAAIRLQPDNALALNNRACLKAERGEIVGAMKDLRRAMMLSPEFTTAKDNAAVLAEIAAGPAGQQTTVSGLLHSNDDRSFCERLVGFLEESVKVAPGFEDCRDDAIQQIVLRVLEESRKTDLGQAAALRKLRKSSTRGWVQSLVSRLRIRGGEVHGQATAAQAEAQERSGTLLKITDVLDRAQRTILRGSQPATGWRRKIVWEVYVGGLVEGISLNRAEVIAAVRKLGVTRRKASDTQLTSDLKLIKRALRSRLDGEHTGSSQ